MPSLGRIGSRIAGSRIGRSAAGRAVGRAGARAGGFAGAHMGAIGAGAAATYFGYKGIKGFAGQVIPAGVDASMDVAFNDPQADRSMLGTDLTPSLYLGHRAPGIIGSTARGLNATRFGVGAHSNPARAGVALGGIGGLVGGALGAVKGYASGGRAGAIRGGILGAAGGVVAGGAIGAGGQATMAYKTMQTNSQIIRESPFYNQSALTAERLNASGNIVFGMHNQRRG